MCPTEVYHIHGLTIASEIDLPELSLRKAHASAPVDVHIRAGRVSKPHCLTETERPYAGRNVAGAVLGFPKVGWFQIDNGSEVTVEREANADPRLLRLFLLGSVMGMLWHQRGGIVLHSSAVAFEDRVVAFAGNQGAGKSTLAAHCLELGARLVADDVLLVSVSEDGRLMASPGMPSVKLWRDALENLGRDPAGLTPDWWRAEKYCVQSENAVGGDRLAIDYLCILEDDDGAGDGIIERLSGASAVAAIVANTYRSEYLDVVDRRREHFRDCARITACLEVVRLARQRDPARLAATASRVARLLSPPRNDGA